MAGIIAYFVGRRVRRTKRLERMLSLPTPRERAEAIYLFLLSRLARLGFKVPAGATLTEFAATNERAMDMITEEARVSFIDATAAYEACAYGHVQPGEDAVVPLAAYYMNFWKAARTHLGNVKYFFKSFRL